jgi:carbonic anhydrase
MSNRPKSEPIPRADFVMRAGAAALSAAALVSSSAGRVSADAPSDAPAMTGSQALKRLLDGNARFAAGHPECGPMTARRAELVNGQRPPAIVLGCSDSRVPIETVFDQEPGNVFVVRLAGNVADALAMGSIEYSVATFKSALLLVLGHTNCGAVNAALEFVKGGPAAAGHIQEVVEVIEPAARETKNEPGDWGHNAVVQNVKNTIASLKAQSHIVSEAVASGALTIQGGVYDLASGKVTLI